MHRTIDMLQDGTEDPNNPVDDDLEADDEHLYKVQLSFLSMTHSTKELEDTAE